MCLLSPYPKERKKSWLVVNSLHSSSARSSLENAVRAHTRIAVKSE